MIYFRVRPFEIPRRGDIVFVGRNDRRFEHVIEPVLDVDPGTIPPTYFAVLSDGAKAGLWRARDLDTVIVQADAIRRGASAAAGWMARLRAALTDDDPRPRAYARAPLASPGRG